MDVPVPPAPLKGHRHADVLADSDDFGTLMVRSTELQVSQPNRLAVGLTASRYRLGARRQRGAGGLTVDLGLLPPVYL